jgi:hypothetical protein
MERRNRALPCKVLTRGAAPGAVPRVSDAGGHQCRSLPGGYDQWRGQYPIFTALTVYVTSPPSTDGGPPLPIEASPDEVSASGWFAFGKIRPVRA